MAPLKAGRKEWLDRASMLVIAITLILFIAAMAEKGFTRDALLETAIFLISVKLVLASQKAEHDNQRVNEKLDRLLSSEEERRNRAA